MISLQISEIKPFMAKLLTSTLFDHYILKELEIQTFTTFHINGKFHEDFFSKEELEERGEQRGVAWGELRSIAFSMIKGNKTPLSMKLIFQLPGDKADKLLASLGGKLKPEEVGGLYLNIRYEKGELRIITGTAIKTFTLDKTLEQEWDASVRSFLKEQGIACEEE